MGSALAAQARWCVDGQGLAAEEGRAPDRLHDHDHDTEADDRDAEDEHESETADVGAESSSLGADLVKFVANLAAKLEPGAVVAILDNEYAEGSSTPVSRRDAEGNTYQTRRLSTGEAFEVLKNFPTPEELADVVRPYAREAHLEATTYYWLMVVTLK